MNGSRWHHAHLTLITLAHASSHDLDAQCKDHNSSTQQDYLVDCSSVTLGNSLDLILLLDGVRVGLSDSLGSGDDLVSESLTHGLH